MGTTLLHGYTHQQLVAASTWTVNFGYIGGKSAVDVFVDIGGERVKIIPKTVIISGTIATITFSAAYTGEAYVI